MLHSEMSQTEIRYALNNGEARFPGAKPKGRNGSAKAKGKKRNNDEEKLQCSCNSWNKLNEARRPMLKWIFHCPNGGGRSKAEAGILKAMGVKPGVPDFMLPFPSAAGYVGLGVELKSETGDLSDDQRNWLLHAYYEGWCISVVRSLDEYIAVVKEFLEGSANQFIKERPVLFGADEVFKGLYE